jgi:hypothetical protein
MSNRFYENVGSAAGRQGLSEEYSAGAGGYNDQVGAIGSGLSSYGMGQVGLWNRRQEPAYAGMQAIASRGPQYSVDRASVDVGQTFDKSKGVMERTLGRMGINPNSGRFVGLNTKWGLAKAAAEAGAMTRARQQAEQEAYQRQGQLMQLGAQGAERGAGLMRSGVSYLSDARQGARGLASDYDRLAGEQAANDAYQESIRRQRLGLQVGSPMMSKSAGNFDDLFLS